MKTKMQQDTKEKYEEVIKLVKKAEKTAQKFIEENKRTESKLRIGYS
ncbi:MAG: hypothetical protein AAB553_02060 [Patescibacteria group bacterium]